MDTGTYCAFYMSEESANRLCEWLDEHNIKHQPAEEMHCTVLYSKTSVQELHIFDDLDVRVYGTVIGWKVLGENALTLLLEIPVAERINELMMQAGGTSDYPDYTPHTTVNPDFENEYFPKAIPEFDLMYDRVVVEPIEKD